jgi:regulator of sigma D
MLEHCQSAKERWGGVSDIIDRWLAARKNLIVEYCGISEIEGSSEEHVAKYQSFCQKLVDYVSIGHFEVYEQLVSEAKDYKDESGIELAGKVLPIIERSTQLALDFNDKFDNVHREDEGLDKLVQDAHKIGEMLEERFELEDMLIESLHNAHADQVA